ncbi:protein translocation complex component [Grosmannia clavigera kw1407]|uniref:Protein translocation complex component n=1 Tax=Grosmannia clavigera (strain kw1407 / UAMH 11150) TaxID=655863 RepID=F0XQ96_GROCL|nr:protein translocation complex component [Grosmannia clavigera kw1407]EFX00369.1 protein translocation complex component [Grosmannia clavigera kw1407]
MSSSYAYDETGQLWPFFAFTLSTIITVPLSYILVSRVGNPAAAFPRIQTDYRPPQASIIDAERAKYRRKQRRIGLILAVVAGWAVMAYTMYLISIAEAPEEQRVWNPYDILGIADSATEKTIKRTYKLLSLKFHPDKIKPDAAKNETLEMLNDRYVEISKAYQALTDAEVRNNYIQYGHPDGKQTTSIGIALPRLMVTEPYGKYVVLFYFLLFGVLLPYVVGSWWYGTQSRSKEGVLMESANRLFHEYADDIDEAALIAALSNGKEFEKLLAGDKAESGLATIETRITAPVPASDAEKTEGSSDEETAKAVQTIAGLSAADRERLDNLDSGSRRKVLALLWAYLGRVDLGDGVLEKSKFEVAPVANALTRSFTAIALAYGNTTPVLASMAAGQLIMQALPPKASPLLQLPHVTAAVARAIEGGDATVHMSVQQLMDLPESKRRRLAVGADRLSATQFEQAVEVARQLPYLRVAKAFFKVTGEKHIIPSSLVSLVVKARFIPPGFAASAPAVSEADLLDVDPAEDDLDALLGRKRPVGKNHDGSPIMADLGQDQPLLAPLAYAPYYGRDHSPRWQVFLTDSKQGKMVVPPFTFTQFDKPLFEADGRTPTFAVQTLKAQFVAPQEAGQYTFALHVVCDCYVGFDTKTEVMLVVEDASRAAEMTAEDDISEPDEDSLAGIMSAAKGMPQPAKKRTAADEDDEDDESGTEEEADDTSDTNTDTEPED